MSPRTRPLSGHASLDVLSTMEMPKSTDKVLNDSAQETRSGTSVPSGSLIVNADDWGRDSDTTRRIFECRRAGTVSSVSAMVFMDDSERASILAKEAGIDAGLHLNLTLEFSSAECSAKLKEQQGKIAVYLSRHSLAQVVFHPGLVRSFDYVVKAQLGEYARLFGAEPRRIDGHHHMHLCANVQNGRLLPAGTLVRRNFSFLRGERSLANRLYRRALDHRLAKRHRIIDFLFPLSPLEPKARLDRIRSLARDFVVEVETHPVNADEYAFLTGGEAIRWAGDVPIASHFALPQAAGRKE